MRWILVAAAMSVTAQPVKAQDRFAQAVEAVQTRVAATDDLGTYPGRALVMVKAGDTPIVDVMGATRAEGGETASGDTPFYIASMTKAFVGLMAVRLDEMGVMPLETTIGEVFPDMKVEGVDFDTLTMRDALSHQLGFRAPALNIRTAYTDLVPVDDYPAIVSAAGTANGEAFRYDNLGYLLYAAALEKVTGKSWRNWIDDVVFDPLAMTHSSARTSDFREVSHLHEEYDDGWRTYAPKSDAVMHAAGGLVISANDMARWLAANAGGESAIPREAFEEAQGAQVDLDIREGPIHCTGYALGWRSCMVGDTRLLEHGGGYTGMRGQMVVLPDDGVAMAVLFNSDSMTGGLSGRLLKTFVGAYTGREDLMMPVGEFAATYKEETETYRSRRSAREREALGESAAWQPSADDLMAISGTYRDPAFGRIDLAVADGMLTGRMNGTALHLKPASEADGFLVNMETDLALEPLAVERDANGAIVGLDYAGTTFTRAD